MTSRQHISQHNSTTDN